MNAAYAVLNSHGEPVLLAPTREQCERYIDTQSPGADCCEIRAYPFPPVWDGRKLIPEGDTVRTRRSPRNQEILWRALGGPTTNAGPRCADCVNFGPVGYARGTCTLLGEPVDHTSQRACFIFRVALAML